MMQRRIVLLFNGEAWGVYNDGTCPSFDKSGPFPEYYYREYWVEDQTEGLVLNRLRGVLDDLREKRIVPNPANYSTSFPLLEDLLHK